MLRSPLRFDRVSPSAKLALATAVRPEHLGRCRLAAEARPWETYELGVPDLPAREPDWRAVLHALRGSAGPRLRELRPPADTITAFEVTAGVRP